MGKRSRPNYELRVTGEAGEPPQYTLRDLRTQEVLVETHDQTVAMTELRRVDPEFIR